jgi:GNAT superfamily N-acetyltransferase
VIDGNEGIVEAKVNRLHRGQGDRDFHDTNGPDPLLVRIATVEDVALMEQCRRSHHARPADERMTAYFSGLHHPHQALLPRLGYIALSGKAPVGYIAGHLTTRFGYTAELQYLFVSAPYRRRSIGRRLVQELARWFIEQRARRVCVCLDSESQAAAPFYTSLGAKPFRPHWYAWEDIALVSS